MMGGDIGVRSVFGVGSTFWFDVVLAEDKTGVSSFTVPNDTSLKGMRVLIVDDNETARIIVREQLAPYGVEMREVSSAKEALDALEKEARFDIAVLDFMMPQMDGVELARKIKGNPATKDIVLLLITSAPKRGDKEYMESIGFAAYLSKPLAHWYLRDALSVICEARQSGKKIPMITQHNLKEAKAGAQQRTGGNLHFSNVHILLAEDNPVNQMVATTMLERYGCRVTPAADGDEAVKQLKQRNFDLVFMDCQMPVMDGYEAARTIRRLEEHQKRQHIPIIAFTANAMKGDDDKCREAGMDDYIPKPVRQNDLERVLLVWLPENKRSGDAARADKITAGEFSNAALDKEVFASFVALMGKNLPIILARYLDAAHGYLQTIRVSVDAGDFKALFHAAHPLASSSGQVGAKNIAELARKIESLASAATPDIVQLKTLAEQIEQAQEGTKQALAPYLKEDSA
jgi:CheY-like chemotaxis protein/HPt (histidine-containing phosphotransfer) domain-containing protein